MMPKIWKVFLLVAIGSSIAYFTLLGIFWLVDLHAQRRTNYLQQHPHCTQELVFDQEGNKAYYKVTFDDHVYFGTYRSLVHAESCPCKQ